MAGLTNIQVTAALHFDNGIVITIATPVWHKDIRDGDFFMQDEAIGIINHSGEALAQMIEEKSLDSLYMLVNERINEAEGKRKPRFGDNFSLN